MSLKKVFLPAAQLRVLMKELLFNYRDQISETNIFKKKKHSDGFRVKSTLAHKQSWKFRDASLQRVLHSIT